MRLLLLRHAEAEFGADDDPRRTLTLQAQRRLAAPDQTLVAELAALGGVLCSPFRRSQQTASLLLQAAGVELPLHSSDALLPGADVDSAARLLEYHANSSVLLVVTHQPLIGCLIPWLCEGGQAPALAPAPGEMAVIELDWPAAGLGQLKRWYRV